MSMPRRCQHVKVNGTQCGSPALRRQPRCYFHQRHHDEFVKVQFDRQKSAQLLELPPLEDANAVQVSIMEILRLMITGVLDRKMATTYLYGLQLASSNLPRTSFQPKVQNTVLYASQLPHSQVCYTLWDEEDWKEMSKRYPDDVPFPYEVELDIALAQMQQEEQERAQQEKDQQERTEQEKQQQTKEEEQPAQQKPEAQTESSSQSSESQDERNKDPKKDPDEVLIALWQPEFPPKIGPGRSSNGDFANPAKAGS